MTVLARLPSCMPLVVCSLTRLRFAIPTRLEPHAIRHECVAGFMRFDSVSCPVTAHLVSTGFHQPASEAVLTGCDLCKVRNFDCFAVLSSFSEFLMQVCTRA